MAQIYCHSSESMHELEDESVHLAFTSPPYYNAKEYSSYKSYEEYLNVLKNVFEEVHRATQEGRFFVLNTSPVLTHGISVRKKSTRHPIPFDLHQIVVDIGWDFIDDIIWLKQEGSAINRNGNFFQNRKPLAYKPNIVTEYIMVYRKRTDKLIDWNIAQYDDDIISDSLIGSDYEKTNVWNICPASSDYHPAVFPIELAVKIIRYYSFKGDTVLDPFMGSGTTLVAAKETKRIGVGYEVSPEYVELAKKRLAQDYLF